MNKLTVEQRRKISSRRGERGFSLIQMVIVIAIIAVITTIAMVGVASARASQRRVTSARLLSGYLEKARIDSVRRRASDTDAANPLAAVAILNANTYRVFLDFDGNGTPVSRDFTLEQGVSFTNEDIGRVISFDWRGRTGNDGLRLEVFNTGHAGDAGYQTNVSVSAFGDVSVNDEGTTPGIEANTSGFASPTPTPPATPTPEPPPPGGTPLPTPTPSATPTPSPTPVPTPTPTPLPTPSPTPLPTPSPTPSATPTPTPRTTPSPTPTPAATPTPQCALSAPGTVTVGKNDGSGTFDVTYSNTNNTVVTLTAYGELISVSPTVTTVSGTGFFTATVKYGNGNKTGTVEITSTCNNNSVTVSTN